MKIETRTSDLRKLVAERSASGEVEVRTNKLNALVNSPADNTHLVPQAYTELRDARVAKANAVSDFAALPPPRREGARTLYEFGRSIGSSAATLGDNYSGETYRSVSFGDKPSARVRTRPGAHYRGSSRQYTKTDATHHVVVDPEGLPLLFDTPLLSTASRGEGLYLIALYPGGRCVWVRSKAKAIVSEEGFVTFDPEFSVCFHSTASLAHAEKGLAKKVKGLREARALADPKVQRRIKLIARMCGHAVATIKDAKALGFCDPGIEAFKARYGFKDKATLPDLIKTGDPSAVRLALELAKKIHLKKVS